MLVKKRDNNLVDFNIDKIITAISKANIEALSEIDEASIRLVANSVLEKLGNVDVVDVEQIHDMVEEELMLFRFTKTAKAYVLHREHKRLENKKDIFKPRKNLKPYEYPELEKYKEAIQHSYWLFSEFNYTSDIQDYKVNISDVERNAIKNTMLAIAQIEVDVKTFWGKLYEKLPKPEFSNVGSVFSESETRHFDAYSNLLELLGLNEEFEKIEYIPALNNRVEYLKRHNKYLLSGRNRDFTIALLLFSSAIEHISLFSQFLIIMSFNKYKNLFSGMSNAIEATSKEEQLHGEFGIDLVNTIKQEHPEWFDESLKKDVYDIFQSIYKSEIDLLNWIFEDGELDFLPKYTIQEFIKNRLNNSLEAIGFEKIFDVDEKEVEKTDWFDDEVVATKHVDFFAKKSVNYTKRNRPITPNDLF